MGTRRFYLPFFGGLGSLLLNQTHDLVALFAGLLIVLVLPLLERSSVDCPFVVLVAVRAENRSGLVCGMTAFSVIAFVIVFIFVFILLFFLFLLVGFGLFIYHALFPDLLALFARLL